MTVLKNSPSLDRHLVAALTAEPAGAPHRPAFDRPAARATPPRWPAQRRQIFGTGLFAGKTLLQLKQRPSTTVVDRMQAGLIRACDSGSTWLGIDVVFATGTNAAGVQCRAIRATAFL